MDNKKLILSYGFNEEELVIIKDIARTSGPSPLRDIKATEGKMTVKELIEGNAFEFYNCTMPESKAVIFNNFSDEELEGAINSLRKSLKEMPILAVVTENSINWTFEKLINHLEEERQWHRLHNR